MGRRKVYQHHNIPMSVVKMVQTLIQDYPRRKRIIEYDSASNDVVKDECIRLNRIIEIALEQREEPLLNSLIISDIINERGYNQSEAVGLASKNLYYKLKRQLIEDIACRSDWI